jgi:hypothetical protein
VRRGLSNRVNPFSSEEVHFVETYCRILGMWRWGEETIKAISCLLEKLGAGVEDHRRKFPRPSQMTQNFDGLEVHACSLKRLEGNIKWLKALDTGYEMCIQIA